MPAFVVLCCYQCKKFQVQQVTNNPLSSFHHVQLNNRLASKQTKTSKWTCKLCGESQSIKRVYFTSCQASECRPIAQQLSVLAGKVSDKIPDGDSTCKTDWNFDQSTARPYRAPIFSKSIHATLDGNEINHRPKHNWNDFVDRDEE